MESKKHPTLMDRTVTLLNDGETCTSLKGSAAVVFFGDEDCDRFLNEGGGIDRVRGDMVFPLDNPHSLRALADLLEQRGNLR